MAAAVAGLNLPSLAPAAVDTTVGLSSSGSSAAIRSPSSSGLPPMVRRVVSRSRLDARPSSAGPLTSTQEIKLASTQAELRAQQLALAAHENEAAASPVQAASVATGVRELGPVYPEFQSLAQRAGADLANGFPCLVSGKFERTSYWKKAPPKKSETLGTIAWIFLHYATPAHDKSNEVTTVAELESESLRLSFRQWLFLCQDWEIVPQLTSKARIAALYERFGGKSSGSASHDVGLGYNDFVRSIAAISLEAQLPRTGPEAHSRSKPSSVPTTAADRCLAFLTHLGWTNMEYVASGVDALERNAVYRQRAALTDAKSVYVHKPTCLVRELVSISGGVDKHAVLRSKPCAHASPAQWAPLEAQIVAGVQDRSTVLHLDPHSHAPHALSPKKKPSVSTLRNMQQTNSASSIGWDEKTGAFPASTAAAVPAVPSPSQVPRPRPGSTISFPSKPSADESAAFRVLRNFERLPMEDTWCSFPGPYIDMGIIEVLPTPTGPPPAPTRDPHALPPAPKPRTHRYVLDLRNRVSASLKVTISSVDLDWLAIEYKQRPLLALGMVQRLRITAPIYMPHDAKPRDDDDGTIGRGVERIGAIVITTENAWTYEVGWDTNTDASAGRIRCQRLRHFRAKQIASPIVILPVFSCM